VAETRSPDPKTAARRRAAIRQEAEDVVWKFADAKDPEVRATVCESGITVIDTDACERAIKAVNPSAVHLKRITDLAARVATGDNDATDALRGLTEELKDKDPAAAIAGARAMQGPDGAGLLRDLTASPKPEIRELAAAALAEKDPDHARQLVKEALGGRGPADVAFQAAIGLAASGDAEQVARVSEWLPNLQGRDRMKAATALVKSGSLDGVPALAQLARHADDEMLRLHAASALIGLDEAAAGDAVARALESENLWVRGEAASLAPRLGEDWLERVKPLLNDPSEWVRLRAAKALLGATAARK
jgi:HEAT repeat protein